MGSRCVYRPKLLNGVWIADACMTCFFRKQKCSANDKEPVAIGEELMFLYEEFSEGDERLPQSLQEPSLDVRVALVTQLVQAKQMRWPRWLKADGMSPSPLTRCET